MQMCSVWDDSKVEIDRHKWIQSQKAGHDLGEHATREWIRAHWCGYLRARWLEHLQGRTFWIELDRGDYGLLNRDFQDKPHLLEQIISRLIAGQENLDVIQWALDTGTSTDDIREILTKLDINSRRLAHDFE